MKQGCLLLALMFQLILFGQDCPKKYYTEYPYPRYAREMAFPWYAVGEGWETRVIAGLPQTYNRPTGLQVSVSTIPYPYTTYNYLMGRSSFPLRDGEAKEKLFGGWFVGLDEVRYNWTTSLNGLQTGIARIVFSALPTSNPCVVNWVFENHLSAQLTFLARDANGVVRWQVSTPGYFVDELSPRWAAKISMSAQPDGRQFSDFEDPSFAVANINVTNINPAQDGISKIKIRIRVYDNFGRPWLDHNGNPTGDADSPEAINTPWYRQYQEKCLTRYVELAVNENFASTIRDFFRSKPEDVSLCGENPLFRNFPDQFFMGWRGYPEGTSFGFPFGFWGTILFEAVKEDGSIDREAKFVPVVIQRVGDSLNNVQLIKLPPETSFSEVNR